MRGPFEIPSLPATDIDPMLPEVLQDRAALYVSGAMNADERSNFELVLEFHHELKAHVERLTKLGIVMLAARDAEHMAPPPELRNRLLVALESREQQAGPEVLVVAGPDCRVQQVNSAFFEMCGYTIDDVRGRKPSEVLQGPETEKAAIDRIRGALRDRTPCTETLINYHRDGSRYRVRLSITPILDDAGEPLWFVAKERKLEAL
jgi:PAS domain S-box-containing protein